MAKAIDLTGQRFGRLIALRPTEQRMGTSVVWECQCDCGNITYVSVSALRQGTTKSCCCLNKDVLRKRVKALTGQRFGRLVAVRPTEERVGSFVVWECRCDCGETSFVASGNLASGNTKSCGCLKGMPKDLTGMRFGKLTALWPTEERRYGKTVVWECQCDCGRLCFVPATSLVSGEAGSCGCL